MLICKKRGRREERTVLLLLLFNTVSEDYVIILKCTIYRDVFHSWKSLYASLWKVTILFTWYNITLCFCTVTDVRANVLFFFFVWQKKSFIFSTVFCNFAVSNLEKERKWGSKKKNIGKQWGLTWLIVLFVLWLSGQHSDSSVSVVSDSPHWLLHSKELDQINVLIKSWAAFSF